MRFAKLSSNAFRETTPLVIRDANFKSASLSQEQYF